VSPILKAENLGRTFSDGGGLSFAPREEVRAVDGVDLEVGRGETLALVGESGCGKSTLGRLLLRLIEASQGKVLFEDTDLMALSPPAMREMRRHVQMIFQDPYGSMSPRRSIAEIISEPLEVFGIGRSGRERRNRVAELLTQVGLSPAYMDRYPRQFSGGQRQRIGIARAIALDPAFIVADEPVSALDVSVQAQIINLMQDLQEQKGFSYLFIAHDLSVVRHISDRVAVMYLGRTMELTDRDSLYEHPMHPYTMSLMSAVPVPDPRKEQRRERILLTGDLPSPANPPSGCVFHTRCPVYRELLNDSQRERCRTEVPLFEAKVPGHEVACHFAGPDQPAEKLVAVATA